MPFTYFISLSANEFTLPAYGMVFFIWVRDVLVRIGQMGAYIVYILTADGIIVASPTTGNLSLDPSSSGGNSKQSLKKTSNYVKSFVMGIVNEVRAHLPAVGSPGSSSKRF